MMRVAPGEGNAGWSTGIRGSGGGNSESGGKGGNAGGLVVVTTGLG